MGMRPVDVQISIPRSAELGRVAQGDQQQNQLRQQELALQSKINTDLYENRVRHTEETESKKVKEQKEREKRQRQQQEKHTSSGSESEKKETARTCQVNKRRLDIWA